MSSQKNIAFILAGGFGKRLGSLTHYYSKPVIYFGNGNRIIDFTIDNCFQSQLKTIGILGHSINYDIYFYIKEKYQNNMDGNQLYYLAPSAKEKVYSGTADALYKNIDFIDNFNPENILVTAGDHVYKMDYNKILDLHTASKADATIAVTKVSLTEASKFGVVETNKKGWVTGFKEKPSIPKSNTVSMGIYVFKWKVLKEQLIADHKNIFSMHDFGMNLIPAMLSSRAKISTYLFEGYWKDVGTLESLWGANMDIIDNKFSHKLNSNLPNGVYSYNSNYIANSANVKNSLISGSCNIFGDVKHSVIEEFVTIEKGAEIIDSVIMPNSHIGQNCRIFKTIVGPDAKIANNIEIGAFSGTTDFIDEELCSGGISLVGPWTFIHEKLKIERNSHISNLKLLHLYDYSDNKYSHKNIKLRFGINP